MREILFRGKRIDNGEWEYGSCVFTENKVCLIYNQTHSIDLQGFTVENNSISQFTGCYDKNGKKIFEGDILKICYDSPLFDGYDTECICYNGIVKYENALFVCEENSERGDALCALSSNEFEIIGNIHDNPELLEVTE